jgi:hypothetical protein
MPLYKRQQSIVRAIALHYHRNSFITNAMANRFRLKPGSQLLLFLICFTLGVWVLRGLTLLSFLPGIVIYLLMLACLTVFVINSARSMR